MITVNQLVAAPLIGKYLYKVPVQHSYLESITVIASGSIFSNTSLNLSSTISDSWWDVLKAVTNHCLRVCKWKHRLPTMNVHLNTYKHVHIHNSYTYTIHVCTHIVCAHTHTSHPHNHTQTDHRDTYSDKHAGDIYTCSTHAAREWQAHTVGVLWW